MVAGHIPLEESPESASQESLWEPSSQGTLTEPSSQEEQEEPCVKEKSRPRWSGSKLENHRTWAAALPIRDTDEARLTREIYNIISSVKFWSDLDLRNNFYDIMPSILGPAPLKLYSVASDADYIARIFSYDRVAIMEALYKKPSPIFPPAVPFNLGDFMATYNPTYEMPTPGQDPDYRNCPWPDMSNITLPPNTPTHPDMETAGRRPSSSLVLVQSTPLTATVNFEGTPVETEENSSTSRAGQSIDNIGHVQIDVDRAQTDIDVISETLEPVPYHHPPDDDTESEEE